MTKWFGFLLSVQTLFGLRAGLSSGVEQTTCDPESPDGETFVGSLCPTALIAATKNVYSFHGARRTRIASLPASTRTASCIVGYDEADDDDEENVWLLPPEVGSSASCVVE
jgi:hypothetical protein